LKRLRVLMTWREPVPERLAGATVVFEAVQGERG